MIRALHFVFRATGSQVPFSSRDHFAAFWSEITSRLDRCLAMVLMPNHGHIIVNEADKGIAARAIRLSLLAFKRKVPSFWDPIPEPNLIPDIKHLRRQVRYVHLNPCRSQFVQDPLCWEYSTHWDYLNYSANSISVPTVQILGFPSKTAFHHFISADSTTRIMGTDLPLSVPHTDGFPIVSLDRVAEVTQILTRSRSNSLSQSGLPRRLFYTLAAAAGYRNSTFLARYLGISQQSVSELLARGRNLAYPEDQARKILCDPRFRSCP